jgi:hypothetical protein
MPVELYSPAFTVDELESLSYIYSMLAAAPKRETWSDLW